MSLGPSRARLKVFNVTERDDGIYRCMVDFKASQTRTSRTNLTVIGKAAGCLVVSDVLRTRCLVCLAAGLALQLG